MDAFIKIHALADLLRDHLLAFLGLKTTGHVGRPRASGTERAGWLGLHAGWRRAELAAVQEASLSKAGRISPSFLKRSNSGVKNISFNEPASGQPVPQKPLWQDASCANKTVGHSLLRANLSVLKQIDGKWL